MAKYREDVPVDIAWAVEKVITEVNNYYALSQTDKVEEQCISKAKLMVFCGELYALIFVAGNTINTE